MVRTRCHVALRVHGQALGDMCGKQLEVGTPCCGDLLDCMCVNHRKESFNSAKRFALCFSWEISDFGYTCVVQMHFGKGRPTGQLSPQSLTINDFHGGLEARFSRNPGMRISHIQRGLSKIHGRFTGL